MVKQQVIKERLNHLITSLNKIERYKSLSLEEFLDDDIIQDIVEYNLFICINMIIDIAIHIVTDEKMGYPNTFSQAFEILYKNDYISKDELETYKNMIGFRNILSHEYVKINKQIVYDIMKNKINDFKRFILFVNDNFM